MEPISRNLLCRLKVRPVSVLRGRVETWRSLIAGLTITVAVLGAARPSPGQEILPPDFLNPRLVINGTGHTGPLRSMVYTPDGKYLLSAGLDKVVHVWAVEELSLRLDRTIRPMIRVVSGPIYAVAVSPPTADDSDKRLQIAVAGLNPLGSGGRILLYRFPSRQDGGTGDLAFNLPPNDGSEGFDVRLLSSVNDVGGIPTKGKNVIIVAAVNQVLHFRIFDGDGRMGLDTNEKKLTERARQIEDLRNQLDRFWPPHKLTPEEKVGAITAITSIVGYSGHRGSVFGLSFSPDGRHLASCGEDQTVRIWDLKNEDRRAAKVLKGHAGVVQRVAFLDREHVVSAGGFNDGALILWEWNQPEPRIVARRDPSPKDMVQPPPPGEGVRVNALAVSPDGRYVVAGRENGKLERYDADLNNKTLLNPEDEGKFLAIESLAYSPDGKSLAVSNLKYPAKDYPNQFPRTECDIRIRSMPDGLVTTTVRTAGDIARGLAFSPDSRFLAMGGGESQEIAVKDLRPPKDQGPDAPPTRDHAEYRGPGTILWHVAFVNDQPVAPDKVVLAFARSRALEPNQPAWEGFDFPKRARRETINPGAQLSGTIKTVPGWKVDTSRMKQVSVVPDAGNPVPIALDPAVDLRWSSYTFIPPKPLTDPRDPRTGHPGLTVAIGCETGMIRIHRLPDGAPTRVLMGHSGAVYGMAPSADGRWLATVSADQTVRLWRLDGCDQRPTLGVTFNGDELGPWVVGTVDKDGFADRMGLAKGDVVQKITLSNRPVNDISKLANEIANMPLGPTTIRISMQRPAQGPGNAAAPAIGELQTTLRDLPALSFLPGHDREWIIWTPDGYYDTSPDGDHKLLGWHVNKLRPVANNQLPRVPLPSDFFPISKYKGQLFHRDFIDTLLTTGQLDAPRPVIREPPAIEFVPLVPAGADPGVIVAVQQPRVNLQFRVSTAPDSQISSVDVYNDTRHDPSPPVNPPAAEKLLTHPVDLHPGENLITIEAENTLKVKGSNRIKIRLDLPPNLEPELYIRSIGVETFADRTIPEIEFAQNDTKKLEEFLLARGGKTSRFRPNQIKRDNVPENASAQRIGEVFDRLAKEISEYRLGSGDTLFVVIESHVLNLGAQGSFLLGADARAEQPDKVSVHCDAISKCLREAAANGCWVVLLLDGIHDEFTKEAQNNLYDWVSYLRDNCKVMVLLASKDCPSRRLARVKLGAFTQAVLDSITVKGRTGNSSGDVNSPTLYDWKEAIIRGVRELTGNAQEVGFYPPDLFDADQVARMRIFEPQPWTEGTLAKNK